MSRRKVGRLKNLPLDWLERGSCQPRRVIDGLALKRLAESIRAEGVLQPIFVRKKQRGKFEIVAGERRWHAARIAGLKNIPTVVGDVSDESALAIALVENLHREDLNPIDQATAMARLVEEFGMTHQEIADTIGKSRAQVCNLIRLLDLPETVCDMVADGELDMGHARALLALPRGEQLKAAEYAARRQLSVRDVEAMVRRARGEEREPTATCSPASDSAQDSDRGAEAIFDRDLALEEGGEEAAFFVGEFGGLADDDSGLALRRDDSGRYHVSFSFASAGELRRVIELLGALSVRVMRSPVERRSSGERTTAPGSNAD